MSLMTMTRTSAARLVRERRPDPGSCDAERPLVAGLEHDRHLGPVVQEARVAADAHGRMHARRLLQDRDDLALPGPVALAPGRDRYPGKTLSDRIEHRLHLAREPREDVDVLEHEPGRTSERVLERLGAEREAGPARRVVAEAASLEALAEPRRHVRDLHAGDAEPVGD